MYWKTLLILLLVSSSFIAIAQEKLDFKVMAPERQVGAGEVNVEISLLTDTFFHDTLPFFINGRYTDVMFVEGRGMFKEFVPKSGELLVGPAGYEGETKVISITVLPHWLSLLPPLIAIVLALIFKEVITALFIGIFSGLLLITGFYPSDWLNALFRFADTYLITVLTDADKVAVILFSFFIGGMVQLVSANGGMAGVILHIRKFANSHKKTQFAIWLSGMIIFFDDYANTLIVGNTMRPLADKYRVSREKLAYIVDSTAAPIAAIAFITTWIGAELGYINDVIVSLGIGESAYSVFINSLKYAYYPVLSLFFILVIIYTGRDFGPMLKAERTAREGDSIFSGQDETAEFSGRKHLWINALLPIFSLVVIAFAALIYTGHDPAVWASGDSFIVKLSETIGAADPYKALLWASFSSLLITLFITLVRKSLSLEKSVQTIIDGIKVMFPAMIILVLAWVLAMVINEIQTAAFIANLFQGNIQPYFLPVIVFIISGLVSFCTGSSWGTMAILYPLFLPVSYHLSATAGLDPVASMEIFYHVTSVVLAGAVFGDHCSPISDTTILSSLSTGCDHVQHVNTQLPYALAVALAVILSGHLPFFFPAFPWYLGYILPAVLLMVLLRKIGRK